jgi:hypothetical protein
MEMGLLTVIIGAEGDLDEEADATELPPIKEGEGGDSNRSDSSGLK